MKTFKLFICMLFIVMATDYSKGQVPHFLSIEEAPLDTAFIGAPPAYGSLLFEYDQSMYLWGISIRNTERGRQAVIDADASADNLCKVFSEAFGMPLSANDTPETHRLILFMAEDAGAYSTRCTKNTYKRTRPYILYGQPSGVPQDEEKLRNNGSYVSGHAAIGVVVSMALATIRPDRQNQLFRRGMEYGISRVITGFHYWSDVRAGQIVGALTFPALLSNNAFQEQLAKAKAEIQKKTEEQLAFKPRTRKLPRGVD